MMWNKIVTIAKWVGIIFLGYLFLASMLHQFLPQTERSLGNMMLKQDKFGKDSTIITIKKGKKTILQATETKQNIEIASELLSYQFPPTSFISISPNGLISIGLFPQSILIILLIILYVKSVRKNRIEREMRLILLEELESRFRARGSNLHDVVINPMKNFAAQLPELLVKQIVAAIPDEDDALQAAMNLHEPLKGLAEQVNQMANQAHEIYRDIAPPIHLIGLASSMKNYLDELARKNQQTTFEADLQDVQLIHENAGIQLFRIMQEAVGNSLLHGQASKIKVQLSQKHDFLALHIQDNGVGFQVPENLDKLVLLKHTGLANMKYRTESIGGAFSINAALYKGTSIIITYPNEPRKRMF